MFQQNHAGLYFLTSSTLSQGIHKHQDNWKKKISKHLVKAEDHHDLEAKSGHRGNLTGESHAADHSGVVGQIRLLLLVP